MVQAGKDAYLRVLDRETGESLFPFEERAVPASNVDGELLAKSQRIPLQPEPFSRQEFSEATVTERTPEAHAAVMEQLRNLDFGGRFTPPSLRGTVVFPGFSGGAEWGGGAYDPETHLYYINANEIAWILRLVTPKQLSESAHASSIYQSQCGGCHRPDMKGAPPEFPALDDLAGKLTDAQLADRIRQGGGRMPSFATLGEPAIEALTAFLLQKEDKEVPVESGPKGPVELKYSHGRLQQVR